MDNNAAFYKSIDRDYMAAGGTGRKGGDNLREWGRLQAGDPRALGLMTTQWSSGNPDTSGIPYAGEFGWNQRHRQRTSGCGV